MVDIDILEKKGISAEKLASVFSLDNQNRFKFHDEDATRNGKLARLRNRIRSRIVGGRDFNMENYYLYQALDAAWDTPLRQISPSLLMSMMDKHVSSEVMVDQLSSWGFDISEVMHEVPDPKSPGKTIKQVNIPAFFRTYVPLVRAYVTIRWAKMMNDRRQVPFYKYEPAISDDISMLRAETVTARIETMSRQYGYFDVVKQSVFRMLHYAEQFVFPVEAWHSEYQLHGKDSPFEGVNAEGEKDYKKVCVKEGVRFHQPHPSRTFYDRSHFPSTFNSDTGCSFAGYWRVMRYAELRGQPNFFNIDKISIGNANWTTTGKARAYFDNVYKCALDFPGLQSAGDGVSKFDSQSHIASDVYASHMDDKSILVTEYFEKLVPSEFGIGDYDYPVWFRFVVASDDTIIYIEPLPYAPVVYYGYDAAEGRTLQSSMTLEVLPFQDHYGNLLSQYLLTVKQNLFNFAMVDTDLLEEKQIDAIEKSSWRFWTGFNLFRFSSTKRKKMKNENDKVIEPYKFPYADTQGVLSAMQVVLDTVERLLVMSSQELAQAASHEQTREEVRNTAQASSSRLDFSTIPVDIAADATKRILYQGLMAYGDDKFWVHVPMDRKMGKEELEKAGFTIRHYDERTRKAKLDVKKSAIAYETFVANREGNDRINEGQLAKAQVEFLNFCSSNPILVQSLGPEQTVKIANQIAKGFGFPRDFKLVNKGPDTTPQDQQAEVQQFIQQAMEALKGEVQQAMQVLADKNMEQDQGLQQQAQAMQAIEDAVKQLAEAMQAAPQLEPPTALDNVPPSAMPMA